MEVVGGRKEGWRANIVPSQWRLLRGRFSKITNSTKIDFDDPWQAMSRAHERRGCHAVCPLPGDDRWGVCLGRPGAWCLYQGGWKNILATLTLWPSDLSVYLAVPACTRLAPVENEKNNQYIRRPTETPRQTDRKMTGHGCLAVLLVKIAIACGDKYHDLLPNYFKSFMINTSEEQLHKAPETNKTGPSLTCR